MIGTEIYFFEEDETLVITIGSVLRYIYNYIIVV